MPALDLTVAGGPIWASRSRVNTDSRDFGVFAASSMQGLLERIVDGDPASYWHSADPSDATTDTITVSFQLRTALVERTFDLVALQNVNLKNFILEYKAGAGAFATVPGTDFSVGTADFAQADLLLSLASPITADTLRLTMFRTQTPNQQKRVAGLYASLATLQLSQGAMTRYNKRYRQTVREVMLGDGSQVQEFVRRSAASYQHYGAEITLDFVSQAERDTLFGIKRDGEPFTWVPEPGDLKREVYTCRWPGEWNERYYSFFKGTGYTIDADVRELGRL